MWYQRLLSKRLGGAVAAIVAVAQSGVTPLELTVSITTLVCAYIAAESLRPSGHGYGNDE
jgi:hypothetical protein